MKQSEKFLSEASLPWKELGIGVRKQIMGYDDKIMLVKVAFQKDAVGALHEHFHSQTTYVESGTFEVSIGKEKKVLRTGDGFFVPSHEIHGVLCLEEGVLIDVFSPVREDFL